MQTRTNHITVSVTIKQPLTGQCTHFLFPGIPWSEGEEGKCQHGRKHLHVSNESPDERVHPLSEPRNKTLLPAAVVPYVTLLLLFIKMTEH